MVARVLEFPDFSSRPSRLPADRNLALETALRRVWVAWQPAVPSTNRRAVERAESGVFRRAGRRKTRTSGGNRRLTTPEDAPFEGRSSELWPSSVTAGSKPPATEWEVATDDEDQLW